MRQRGSGTIRKLKSGYQARYMDESGKQVPAPHIFKTKADANLWLSDRVSRQARGTWLDPRAGSELFRDYGGQWLKERDYTPRSRQEAERLWRLHVEPGFGHLPLSKITPQAVRTWRADRLKTTGPATVRLSYNLLKAMLTTAVADELIAKNPCQIKGASKSTSKKRPLMTLDHALSIVAELPAHLQPLVIVTWWSSVRLGEALALQWRDVDLDGGLVHVHRQVVKIGSDLIETPPKAHSDRFVPIPAETVELLRDHRSKSGRVLPSARVFTNRDGLPLTPHGVGQAWRRARTKAGLPQYRFHDLRHGSATLAAQSGATLYEVMQRLGHRSMNAAIGYQHAASERGSLIAASMVETARLATARRGRSEAV